MSYTTKPTPTLDQLANVDINDVANNDVLQYNSTTGKDTNALNKTQLNIKRII